MLGLLALWHRINQNRHVRKVTGTKITAFYAALTFSYCFIQVIFLVSAWDVGHTAVIRFRAVVQEVEPNLGDRPRDFITIESTGEGRKLWLCPGISESADLEGRCQVVFPI